MSDPKQPTTPSSSPCATSPSLAPQARHTCASLRRRHGASSRESIRSYVWGMSVTEVHALGVRATEARLERDGARILGAATDFLDGASAAQKQQLATLDGPFLAAAATSLDAAATAGASDARRDRARSARRAADKRSAKDELALGRKRRAVYVQQLVQQAGGSASWGERIRKDAGAVADLDALANSLETLAVDATELRADAAAAGAPVVLDAGFEAQLRADAAALRGKAERTEGAPAAPMQGDRMWNRGVAAWFLLRVVDAFGSANELDPSVPRVGLQQLRALRPKASKKNARGAKKAAAKKADDAKKTEGEKPAVGGPATPDKG
jgi:hypothetical protein